MSNHVKTIDSSKPNVDLNGVKKTLWGFRYLILAVVWILFLINYLDRIAVLTCLPYIQTDLKLTPQEVGWLGSIFFAAYASAQFLSGYLTDKFGPKKTMSIAILVFTFFTFVTGIVRTFGQFLIVRLGLAIGEGQHYIPALKSIANWFPDKEKGRATSLFSASWLLAPAICPLVISFMLANFFDGDWRPIFFVLAAPGLIGVFLLYKYVDDTPKIAHEKGLVSQKEYDYIVKSQGDGATHDNTSYRLSIFLKDYQFYCIVIQWVFQQMIFWGMTAWITMFLVRQHSFNIKEMGLYAALPYVVAVGASLLSGFILDKVFHQRIRSICIFAYLGCIPILYSLGQVEKGNTAALILLLALSGAFVNMQWPCLQSYPIMRYPRQVVGRVMGIVNGCAYFGAFVSPLLAGYIVRVLPNGQYDFSNVFIFLAALAVVAGTASLFLGGKPIDPKPYEIRA